MPELACLFPFYRAVSLAWGQKAYGILYFENAWALWVFHSVQYEIPHPLTFFPDDFCFIAAARLWCFFSIASTRQSQRCTFLRLFVCSCRLAFHIRVNFSPPWISSIVSSSGLSMCCHWAKRRMFVPSLFFPSFICINWRWVCILSYHSCIIGLKLLSGGNIFLQFFSACTLISAICL